MKIKILIAILFISAIIAAFFAFQNVNKNKKEVVAENTEISVDGNFDLPNSELLEYDDLKIEKISLDGIEQKFSLFEGRVLDENGDEVTDGQTKQRVARLALFYQWIKEDPLFFSATLDTEKFEKSVNSLDKEQEEFLKSKEYKQRISPISFLNSFSEASKQYHIFSGDISERNADDLFGKMEKAQTEYVREARDLKGEIGLFEKSFAKLKFVNVGNKTYASFDLIIRDFEKIIENGNIVAKELEKRKKCLRESVSFCERPIMRKESLSRETLDESEKPKILPKNKLIIRKNQKYFGPFEVDSKCWNGNEKQYLYYSVNCSVNKDYCMEEPVLATDAFFMVKLKEEIPVDKFFLEKKAKALPQNATTAYACSDLEYKPKLTTVASFYARYAENRLFSSLLDEVAKEDRSVIESWISAENDFFDSEYPSEESLENLAKAYFSAYAYVLKSKQEFDSGVRFRRGEVFLERYLFIREKMNDIDLSINNARSFFSAYKMRFGFVGENEGGGEYLYSVRSHYSLMFLGFSSSIWRSEERPEFIAVIESEKGEFPSTIVGLEEAEKMFGEENLSRWRNLDSELARRDLMSAH